MNNQNHSKLLKLAVSAVVAAVYAALTIALAPISYGPIQFRVLKHKSPSHSVGIGLELKDISCKYYCLKQ